MSRGSSKGSYQQHKPLSSIRENFKGLNTFYRLASKGVALSDDDLAQKTKIESGFGVQPDRSTFMAPKMSQHAEDILASLCRYALVEHFLPMRRDCVDHVTQTQRLVFMLFAPRQIVHDFVNCLQDTWNGCNIAIALSSSKQSLQFHGQDWKKGRIIVNHKEGIKSTEDTPFKEKNMHADASDLLRQYKDVANITSWAVPVYVVSDLDLVDDAQFNMNEINVKLLRLIRNALLDSWRTGVRNEVSSREDVTKRRPSIQSNLSNEFDSMKTKKSRHKSSKRRRRHSEERSVYEEEICEFRQKLNDRASADKLIRDLYP